MTSAAGRDGSLDSRRISQLQRLSLRKVRSQPHARISRKIKKAGKRHHNICKNQQGFFPPRRGGNLLETQEPSYREESTNERKHQYHSQTLTLGSGGGSAEQNRVFWGDTVVWSSRKRAEGAAIRISVMSLSPILQMSYFLSGALYSLLFQPGGMQ